MTAFLRLWRCAFIVAVASTTTTLNAQLPALRRDSVSFAVLVRSLAADSGLMRSGGIRIDPTPLVDGDSPVADRDQLAPPSEMARTRGNTLRMIGARAGDATVPPSCSGIMVPYSPATHAGCPSQWRLVASIGLPRDSAAAPEPDRTQRVTVRLAITEVGPGGFSVLYFSYVLELVESNWKVVGRRLDRFVE